MQTQWLRTHITRQELTNRFIIGDELNEERKTRSKTPLDWQQCIEEHHISRDQATRYIRIAKRFSQRQRERIIELQLPWRFVEIFARDGISDEYIDQFLEASKTMPTIDDSLSLLYKIIYKQETSANSKEMAESFLGYLEDTVKAMRRYFKKYEK